MADRNDRWPAAVLGCLLSLPLLCQDPAATTSVQKQLPADVRAFRAARNAAMPQQRVAALRAFLKNYPESESISYARRALFETLLKNFPDRQEEIDPLARQMVAEADKGYERWDRQIFVADELAGAGPNGVDLALAEKWVLDTDRQMTEGHYNKAQIAIYKEYGADPPTPEELHRTFQHKRAEILLVRAHVLLKQDQLQQATELLTAAAALEPATDELNYLRGEIALKQHRDADALTLFQQAQLLGELPPQQHEAMLALYRAAHNGSLAGLNEELDRRYATLFPPPFQPGAHKPAVGDHTVLLELYSGSGCGPCVGSDLAIDALLKAYPRTEVVALSFGAHVPLPDPLANPSTIYRAYTLGVTSTPQYALDGKLVAFGGADRSGAEALYNQISAALDKEIVRNTGVRLTLTVAQLTGGTLHAAAGMRVESETALHDAIAPKTDVDAESETVEQPKTATMETTQTSTPQLVVRFALVEDEVRYSGENGIRFHRMVVRSVKKTSEAMLPQPGADRVAEANFDLAEVSRVNAAYLESYERSNDSFGPVKFLSNDTTMQPDHLAIAAWVEDSATHRVLQAAFAPLNQRSVPSSKQ